MFSICCVVSLSIFMSCAVFWQAQRLVQIQTISKNSQQYYTTKCLMRDLSSNTPNCFVCAGEFRGYLFTGNVWQKYAKWNGIGRGNLLFNCFCLFDLSNKLVSNSPAILTLRCQKNNTCKFICLPFFHNFNPVRHSCIARKPV